MNEENKEIINFLKDNVGRNLSNPKAEFFRNTSIEILKKFETRSYGELELFCEFLLHSGKGATIKLLGVEGFAERITDDNFYKKALEN